MLHDQQRNARRGGTVTDQEHRHSGVALAQFDQQLDAVGVAFAAVHFPADEHALNGRVRTQDRCGVREAFRSQDTDATSLYIVDQMIQGAAKHRSFVRWAADQ
ncbi:hypothetical protein D3C72_2035320 [compost metagenome]